jgi:branched-subunit amino acid ABC-type transport system permease component
MGAFIAIMSLGCGLRYRTTQLFRLGHAGGFVLAGYGLWFVMSDRDLHLASIGG